MKRRIVKWSPHNSNQFVVASNDLRLYEHDPSKDVLVPEEIQSATDPQDVSYRYREKKTITSQGVIYEIQQMKCLAWCPEKEPDPNLIAVGLYNGKVQIATFSNPKNSIVREFSPRHSRTCNAIAWNPHYTHQIAAGLDKVRGDFSTLVWDVNRAPSSTISLNANNNSTSTFSNFSSFITSPTVPRTPSEKQGSSTEFDSSFVLMDGVVPGDSSRVGIYSGVYGSSSVQSSSSSVHGLRGLHNYAGSGLQQSDAVVEVGNSEATMALAWVPHNPDLLVAGTGVKWLRLYDLRMANHSQSSQTSAGTGTGTGSGSGSGVAVSVSQQAMSVVAHSRAVLGVVFDPFDSNILATFNDVDGVVKLWDVRVFHEPTFTLPTRAQPLHEIEFSRHKDILITAGREEKAIRLWNIKDARCMLTAQQTQTQTQTQAKQSITPSHSSANINAAFTSPTKHTTTITTPASSSTITNTTANLTTSSNFTRIPSLTTMDSVANYATLSNIQTQPSSSSSALNTTTITTNALGTINVGSQTAIDPQVFQKACRVKETNEPSAGFSFHPTRSRNNLLVVSQNGNVQLLSSAGERGAASPIAFGPTNNIPLHIGTNKEQEEKKLWCAHFPICFTSRSRVVFLPSGLPVSKSDAIRAGSMPADSTGLWGCELTTRLAEVSSASKTKTSDLSNNNNNTSNNHHNNHNDSKNEWSGKSGNVLNVCSVDCGVVDEIGMWMKTRAQHGFGLHIAHNHTLLHKHTATATPTPNNKNTTHITDTTTFIKPPTTQQQHQQYNTYPKTFLHPSLEPYLQQLRLTYSWMLNYAEGRYQFGVTKDGQVQILSNPQPKSKNDTSNSTPALPFEVQMFEGISSILCDAPPAPNYQRKPTSSSGSSKSSSKLPLVTVTGSIPVSTVSLHQQLCLENNSSQVSGAMQDKQGPLLPCTVHWSPGRAIALHICGWLPTTPATERQSKTNNNNNNNNNNNASSTNNNTPTNNLETVVAELEANGQWERAAALCCFHFDLKRAISCLLKGAKTPLPPEASTKKDSRFVYQLVAMALAGCAEAFRPPSSSLATASKQTNSMLSPQQNQNTAVNVQQQQQSLWRETCLDPVLLEQLKDEPYLRACFSFVQNMESGQFQSLVSQSSGLSWLDRVGFACRFFDDSELTNLLNEWMAELYPADPVTIPVTISTRETSKASSSVSSPTITTTTSNSTSNGTSNLTSNMASSSSVGVHVNGGNVGVSLHGGVVVHGLLGQWSVGVVFGACGVGGVVGSGVVVCDVLGAVCVCACVVPRVFSDVRWDVWRRAVAALLDTWAMHTTRARLDIAFAQQTNTATNNNNNTTTNTNTTLTSNPLSPQQSHPVAQHLAQQQHLFSSAVPPQVFARCNFCNQNLTMTASLKARPGAVSSRSRSMADSSRGLQKQKISSCPSCKKVLPRCSLCLMPMSCSVNTNRGPSTASKDPNAISQPFDEWFTWCQSCRHGGHTSHILEWFKTHTLCPVTDCNCKCFQ